jgi:glycerol-3-phosphate dehydrogenase
VPRSHVLVDHARTGLPGLVTVVGGKLTTYRQLAEDAVDDVFKRLGRTSPPCPTRQRLLPGAWTGDPVAFTTALARQTALPQRSVNRLIGLYGRRATEVWALAEADPTLGAVVEPKTGLIAAELVFAVDREMAVTLADVMARRVLMAFEPDHGLGVIDHAVTILGDHLGWDAEQRSAEIDGYRQWLDHLAVPNPSGPRSVSFGAGVAAGRQ